MSARCNHRHALTLADETIGRLKAENAALVAERDAARVKLAEINRIALEVMGQIQATAEKA